MRKNANRSVTLSLDDAKQLLSADNARIVPPRVRRKLADILEGGGEVGEITLRDADNIR